MNFKELTWYREVNYDDCIMYLYGNNWEFRQGTGPLFEVDPILNQAQVQEAIEESFDSGFAQGYSVGYEDRAAETDYMTDDVEPELLVEYLARFPSWVDNQSVSSHFFTCDSEVRIEHPFPEDMRIWALWVAHDCSDLNLMFTVILDEEAEANAVGYYGAELSNVGCQRTFYFEGSVACEFELLANGNNFALIFTGGFTPVTYLENWEKSETAVVPAFNWW